MNLSAYQIMALLGALAGIAIVFTLGYLEGRRSLRMDLTRASADYRKQVSQQRETLQRVRRELQHARHELDIQRHNVAQALEAATSERDHHIEKVATLQLRLITANERFAALQARSLNDEAAEDLAAMAAKLSLAATQFGLMGATDQANSTRALAAKARDLSQRYYDALPVQAQQQERAA